MKKYITSLFSISILAIFVSSCGSDITPPNNNGGNFDRKELLGKKTGSLKIDLLPGKYKSHYSTSEAMFSVVENDKNKLHLAIINPDEVSGVTFAKDFKTLGEDYLFKVEAYTPSEGILEGDKIPTFIRDWYPNNELTKVVLSKAECIDARYVRKTDDITLIFKGNLHAFVGETNVSGDMSITYTYTELKNK